MFKISALFLLLSGIASLTYQVVWVRLLGLSLGSTSASISTVLAAFFLGLALGSYLAEKLTRNNIDTLRIYIYLELIIGLSSLALLPVLLNLDLYVAAVPVIGATVAMKFVSTLLLLIIPTVCMGATFPVMASLLIRKNHEVGVRISQLYSLNTAGAVLGAALAGFLFIPNWGLDGAIYIAFSINMLIVVLAYNINRTLKLPAPEAYVSVENNNISKKSEIMEEAPLRKKALIVLFATGFIAIATEVGWTKYLSIFTGTTIYGFAAILTIFLSGIAAGSWFAKLIINKIHQPELWLSFGLIVLGGVLLVTRATLVWVPELYGAINHSDTSSWIMQLLKYFIIFILLFPATFIFGAIFPLNLKLYCGNILGVRSNIGKAYAINTMASIFGSLIAGFYIIPNYGTDALLTIMALVLIVVPVIFLNSIVGNLKRNALIATIIVVAASNWMLPNIRYDKLITSVQFDAQSYKGQTPKYLYLNEGKAGVISMVTFDGRYARLQNNGLNESYLDMKDQTNILLVESLLGLVPYLLHKKPESAFVVGFGGGTTTKALTLTPIKSIRVVELEPSVIEAVRTVYGGEISALNDPRVTLDINDARNTLLTEKTRYDIIASQPSHPWLARASNVFSSEFYTLAKSRLNDDGIFAQWVSLFQMDKTTLKSLFKSFFEIFPYGMTFADLRTGDLIMFGSDEPIIFNFKAINKRLNYGEIKASMQHRNIANANDLMMYFALSRQQALMAAGDVPLNTDLNILTEVRLSKNTKVLPILENPYNFLRNKYTFDLQPYIKDNYIKVLYDIGNYYINNTNAALLSKHTENQLLKLDEVKWRGVMYEKMWRRSSYDEASKLYIKHEVWPDRIHVLQALLLSERGAKVNSMLAVERITDKNIRLRVKSNIFISEAEISERLANKVNSDISSIWALVGLSEIML